MCVRKLRRCGCCIPSQCISCVCVGGREITAIGRSLQFVPMFVSTGVSFSPRLLKNSQYIYQLCITAVIMQVPLCLRIGRLLHERYLESLLGTKSLHVVNADNVTLGLPQITKLADCGELQLILFIPCRRGIMLPGTCFR